MHYVRLIADALLALGQEVEIAHAWGAKTSGEFAVHLSPLSPTVRYVETDEVDHGGPWGKLPGTDCELYQTSCADSSPTTPYIPYVDGLTQCGALEATLRIRRLPAITFVEPLHLRGHFAYEALDFRSEVVRPSTRTLIRRAPWDCSTSLRSARI